MFFFFLLRKPLFHLLDELAKSIPRLKTLPTPWGEATYKEANDWIYERELFRSTIEVALTGKELEHDELRALKYLIQGFPSYGADIKDSIGLKLLDSSFKIAMGDDILQDQERLSLINQAMKYGWSEQEAAKLIDSWENKYKEQKKSNKKIESKTHLPPASESKQD